MLAIKDWSKIFRLLALGGSLLLLNACALVETKRHPGSFDASAVSKASPNEHDSSGFSYFLPKKRIKISATGTLILPKEFAEQLTKKKAALIKAEKNKTDAKEKLDKDEAILKNLKNNKASQEAINEATKNRDLSKEEFTTAEIADTKENKELNQLLDLMKGTNPPKCPVMKYSFKLELLESEPDPTAHFQASTKHWPWRDDEFTIMANEKGLLSSTKLTSTDRTADILVEIAKTISAVVMPGPRTASTEKQPEPECPATPEPFVYENIFDPTIKEDVEEINNHLTKLASIKSKGTNGENVEEAIFNVKVMGDKLTQESARKEGYSTDFKQESDQGDSLKGLLYRRLLPYIISVSMKNGNEYIPMQSSLVMLPNKGPVSLLPYSAGPFVRTVYDVKFNDGILTQWDQNKPSELLAAVRIPIELLKAILSGPAEIIKLRFDLSNENKKLLEAQKTEIEAAKALQDLRDQINAQKIK